MVVCARCGHRFRTRHNHGVNGVVLSCANCTKLFPDNIMEDMIREFMK